MRRGATGLRHIPLARLRVIDGEPGMAHRLGDFFGGDPVGIVDDMDAAVRDAGGVNAVHFVENRAEFFFSKLIAEVVDFELQFFEFRHQERFRLANRGWMAKVVRDEIPWLEIYTP